MVNGKLIYFYSEKYWNDANVRKFSIPIADPKQESAGTSRIQDDDFIMEDVLCDIDPITKAPLQNPVRNKKCRHIYGRDSITESLNMNPRLRWVTKIILCNWYKFIVNN